MAIPQLGPFIGLIGAVCLSTLGLMFPSIIEIVTYYERPGWGRFNWILWKNILLICFGVIGFCTGTYVSIQEIVAEYEKSWGSWIATHTIHWDLHHKIKNDSFNFNIKHLELEQLDFSDENKENILDLL